MILQAIRYSEAGNHHQQNPTDPYPLQVVLPPSVFKKIVYFTYLSYLRELHFLAQTTKACTSR